MIDKADMKDSQVSKVEIVTYSDGTKLYVKNGNLHREDGPALEMPDGHKQWWLNDKQYSEKEWKALTK